MFVDMKMHVCSSCVYCGGVYVCMCVCICVCACMCVCMCVCVCGSGVVYSHAKMCVHLELVSSYYCPCSLTLYRP